MDFYQKLVPYYDELFPSKQAAAKFIEARLGKSGLNQPHKDGQFHLLDVGCATGELVLQLNNPKIQAIGIDSNQNFIDLANQKLEASQRGGVQFIHLDMLAIQDYFQAKTFDCIVCMGNTLPHLSREEDGSIFFQQAFDLLAPGGLLIFQVVNFDNISSGKDWNPPILESPRARFSRHYHREENSSKLVFQSQLDLKQDHKSWKSSIELLPLSVSQWIDLAEQKGFQKHEMFSGFNEKPFKPQDMGVVFTAFSSRNPA